MPTNPFRRQPKQSPPRGRTGELCLSDGTYVAEHKDCQTTRELIAGDTFPHCKHGLPTQWKRNPPKGFDQFATAVAITFIVLMTVGLIDPSKFLSDFLPNWLSHTLSQAMNITFFADARKEADTIAPLLITQATLLLILVNRQPTSKLAQYATWVAAGIPLAIAIHDARLDKNPAAIVAILPVAIRLLLYAIPESFPIRKLAWWPLIPLILLWLLALAAQAADKEPVELLEHWSDTQFAPVVTGIFYLFVALYILLLPLIIIAAQVYKDALRTAKASFRLSWQLLKRTGECYRKIAKASIDKGSRILRWLRQHCPIKRKQR